MGRADDRFLTLNEEVQAVLFTEDAIRLIKYLFVSKWRDSLQTILGSVAPRIFCFIHPAKYRGISPIQYPISPGIAKRI